MKIAFVFGTRPEIIKMSPIIRQCIKRKIPFFTVHSGQHYSKSMSALFLKELELPTPDYNIKIKSKAPYRQGDHTGRMMIKLEEIILDEMPTIVLVQGDTNTALTGALTTSKISTTKSYTGFDIKVGHIEAGLRSHDRSMPEEINRVIIDHLSDYLFVPSSSAYDIVVSEGIKKEKTWITGNTIVDAVYHSLGISVAVRMKRRQEDGNKSYILLTLHRQENVDNKRILKKILKGVKMIAEKYKLPVVFPVHPRTVKMFNKFGIKLGRSIKMMDPCGFHKFLQLEANARIVFTDSGGVQEETCALNVPCVTLRTSTERPETVDVGANIIAGIEPDDIFSSANKMFEVDNVWKNPYGDGQAANKILDIITKGVKE